MWGLSARASAVFQCDWLNWDPKKKDEVVKRSAMAAAYIVNVTFVILLTSDGDV